MGNRILFGAVNASLLLLSPGLFADETTTSAHELEKISVQDSVRGTVSDDSESYNPKTPVTSATGLPMSLKETPQSVTVVTRTKMDDFGQYTVNDVLENTTGVTVQRAETDRTYYTSRGFDITNFQYDGLGLPLSYGIARGQQDTAIFERVEIIRGANGLMTGVGNPSATVNFVRKRATADNRGSVSLTGGSWNTYRGDVDLSGSLTSDQKVRGRLVTAYRDGESYLDRYEKERGVFYGTVEADLTDNTLLTLGYSYQNDNAGSPLWGSLPLYYQDGGATDYDVSTSTSADWSYWNHNRRNAFVELKQQFDNGWEAKGVYTYRKLEGTAKLFYVYGVPDRNDNGLFAYPSLYDNQERQEIYDLMARGPFEVGGRTHELVVGLNQAKGEIEELSDYGFGIGTPLTPDEAFGGSFAERPFGAAYDGSEWEDRYRSAYLATRLSLAEPLTLVAGTRYLDVESEGVGYSGTSRKSSASENTPYVGLIFDITDQHSLYASYTNIFTPQTELGADGGRLDPIEGNNTEMGVKSDWFSGRLNTSLVAFQTEQSNLAEVANPGAAPSQQFHKGVDVDSYGYEAEVSGELSRGWMLTAGYTWLEVEDEDGDEIKKEIPRELIRLATTYRPAALEKLKLGMSLNWQDSISRERTFDPGNKTRQGSYTLVNLIAGYDFTDQLSATLRVNNVTDEKYLTTLRWDQGYYGAPRNANVSVNYKF
ncbi:MAG: TonB-dependent siderophore receptor [Pseudomonadota bacterium]|nr:TonB-dependent siderophore receptor [Pseudomonadota bacterium]